MNVWRGVRSKLQHFDLFLWTWLKRKKIQNYIIKIATVMNSQRSLITVFSYKFTKDK